MNARKSRLKSEWTTHYDEPELHVTDEFRELDILVVDAPDCGASAVMYGPDDGDATEWFQCPESMVTTPER